MSSIGSINQFRGANETSSGGGGLSTLSTDDFTKIIFAELSRQDPLSPQDTNTMIQQLSTLRSIQSDIDLTDSLAQLTSENSFSSAATLIGKWVSGVSEDNQRTIGQVVSVSRTSDGAVLNLDNGLRVPMSRVDEVVDPDKIP